VCVFQPAVRSFRGDGEDLVRCQAAVDTAFTRVAEIFEHATARCRRAWDRGRGIKTES
jgi:hypothetical protein